MALSLDLRKALARKTYIDCLGREPNPQEQAVRAQQIADHGYDVVLGEVYDSQEAKAFRKKRGW